MSDRAGFQYWREPLFVVAAVLYLANSLWWKPMSVEPASFVRCYFGDVLCMPVCLPVTLWLQRRVGVRFHDRMPSGAELLLHWILWSCCFELLAPRLPSLAPGAVCDPLDAVAYAVGGLFAGFFWRSGTSRSDPDLAPVSTASWPQQGGRFVVAVAVAALVLSGYRFGVVFR